MALIDTLVSLWRLEEASGSRDDTWGSNNLTDNNTVGQAAGKLGDAADFNDAADEYLSLADNVSLDHTSGLTVTGWVWFDSFVNGGQILGKYGTNLVEFQLDADGASNAWRLYTSTNGLAGTTVVLDRKSVV